MLHTLAAIQAELGKTGEARGLILQAMTLANLDEPNSECWYVFGRIAEQHGVPSAAKAMYARVKAEEATADPVSTVTLSRRRLAAIAEAR
ncbi:MAG: hypothetical protein K2X03_15740 [Bryobacteraceae bacterium]|nr:hypothetical protein [Bryobacteraceae bacterium]